MNNELTTRLKNNLEWLAEKMPEKFSNIQRLYFRLNEKDEDARLILYGKDIIILPDPKREFSNSLGRIVWEAFGDRILLESNIQKNGELKYHIHLLNKHNQCSFGIDLHSTTELSAQIESVCIRIEQERKKQ